MSRTGSRLNAEEVAAIDACDALTRDESRVLRLYYGTSGGRPLSDGQIAGEIGKNAYTVRTLRHAAQNKVRGSMAAKA